MMATHVDSYVGNAKRVNTPLRINNKNIQNILLICRE